MNVKNTAEIQFALHPLSAKTHLDHSSVLVPKVLILKMKDIVKVSIQ